MKKSVLCLLVLAVFAYSSAASADTVMQQIRSAFTGNDVRHDSIKEDAGCCLPGNAFCLTEKIGDAGTFCLTDDAIKDLGITEAQRTKIRELARETKENLKERCKDLKRPEKGASEEECAAYRQKMRDICEKAYPECMAKLEKILDKSQIDKMQARVFQYFGLVPNGIVLGVLELTGDQKRQLAGLCEETCNDVHRCLAKKKDSGDRNKEELGDEIRACRKECAEKIRKILTPEQLAKADKLLAETPTYVQKLRNEHDPLKTASASAPVK